MHKRTIMLEPPHSKKLREANVIKTLKTAIKQKNVPVVQIAICNFLKEGFELNKPYFSERTALHLAVDAGDVAVAKELVIAGAHPLEAKDKSNRSALFFAAIRNSKEILKCFLLSHHMINPYVIEEKSRTLLHVAAMYKAVDVITFLLNCYPHPDFINHQDEKGNTALHIAAYTGNQELVTLLLRLRANQTLENKEKLTPSQNVSKFHPITFVYPPEDPIRVLSAEEQEQLDIFLKENVPVVAELPSIPDLSSEQHCTQVPLNCDSIDPAIQLIPRDEIMLCLATENMLLKRTVDDLAKQLNIANAKLADLEKQGRDLISSPVQDSDDGYGSVKLVAASLTKALSESKQDRSSPLDQLTVQLK